MKDVQHQSRHPVPAETRGHVQLFYLTWSWRWTQHKTVKRKKLLAQRHRIATHLNPHYEPTTRRHVSTW